MRSERLMDVSVVVLSLIAASIFLKFFADDLGATTSRTDEKPVGTVIFKRKTAQRRYADRAVWESLSASHPVYGMDALRTAEDAEASIRLDDGTEINLQENSLVVLAFAGRSRRLEFVSGSITAVGSGKSDLRITTETSEVTVAGSTADLRKDASGSVSLASLAGTVRVATKGGEERLLGVAEEATLGSGGTRIVAVATGPLAPSNGARFAAFQLPARIAFTWYSSGGTDVLELSGSRDFREIALSLESTSGEAAAELGAGSWFWRVRGTDGLPSRANGLRIFPASGVEPVAPAEGSSIAYRSTAPRVRLEWSLPAEVAEIEWELARDADFTRIAASGMTLTSSALVGPLEGGTWYWRAAPRFGATEIGTPPFRPRSFSVVRLQALPAPSPISPVDDRTVNADKLAEAGLSLAWTAVRDASSYTVAVAEGADFASPLSTLQVDSASALLPDGLPTGRYHWRVVARDALGEESPPSSVASFRIAAADSPVELDSPPDGYALAQGTDRLLVWKGDAAASYSLRVELEGGEPGAGPVVLERTVRGITHPFPSLPAGAYRWSVAPSAAPERRAARTFSVLDPIPAPAAIVPADGSSFSLVNSTGLAFSWAEVAGADAYRLVLRTSGGKIVAEAEPTEPAWTFGGALTGGSYRWTLRSLRRARADAEPLSSAEAAYAFTLRSVRSVGSAVPDFPADDERIDGLAARKPGIRFSFKPAEAGATAVLLVSTVPDFSNVADSAETMEGSAVIAGLAPGRYFWKLASRSPEGLELPESRVRSFIIERIAPLPAPSILSPLADSTVDMQSMDSLPLSWTRVQGANAYEVRLVEEASGRVVWSGSKLPSSEVSIADLERLDVGSFILSVSASTLDGEGKPERGGTESRVRFSLSLGSVPLAPAIITPRKIYVP